MVAEVMLPGRAITREGAPYVIAEVGVHHQNDMDLAREYVRAARDSGADAVKFQTYTADRLAARWAPTYWDDGSRRTQHDIFAERSLLTRADYVELFRYADQVGITFLSTPFDVDAAEMLNQLGMHAFKIASADLTDRPLLERVARFGKPVLLSTGAATLQEVDRAARLFVNADVPLVLLHCSLAYPTPVEDANLRKVTLLSERFPDVVIGYSDHTQPQDSELACPLAVALGARVVEKHFTLDKSASGDDHYHAVDPAGLARLVIGCRQAWQMTGTPCEMTAAELPARSFARRSIVAARNLRVGHVLGVDDVDFKRPGTGMSPEHLGEVLGRVLVRDVRADELISQELLR